jgi:hypothetical protein
MKPVVKKATPAAIAVLRQATAIAPSRMKASDGLLPSNAHLKQSPTSDHNTGLAVDLTHDPKNGIDCADIFEAKQGNRQYTGSNPHNKHLHISIDAACSADTSPWFWWLNQPKIISQVIAKVTPVPAKKAYTKQVCTCCKLHSTKS